MRETRVFHNVEVRVSGKGPNGRPVVTLQAVKPGVVDDYGSLWLATTFDESMTTRTAADPDDTPSLCWGHDWTDAIGHGIGYTPTPTGPLVDFELDEFDAVPRARQADAQLRSKTYRDCSVGFSQATRRPPSEDEVAQYPGVKEVIEKAYLDEVSVVLRGAVPGAKVLALRSAQVIDATTAADVVAKFASGTIDLLTALQQIKEAAVDDAPKSDDKADDADAEAEPTEAEKEAEAEAQKEVEALEADTLDALAKVASL